MVEFEALLDDTAIKIWGVAMRIESSLYSSAGTVQIRFTNSRTAWALVLWYLNGEQLYFRSMPNGTSSIASKIRLGFDLHLVGNDDGILTLSEDTTLPEIGIPCSQLTTHAPRSS
jgi:hypothetical protein